MIFRRPIRDVVEERHGRTCGVHVFLFYILALGAVLAMSTACLSATERGYFSFDQQIHISIVPHGLDAEDGIDVDYEITYGWRSACTWARAEYTGSDGQEQVEEDSGCFGLAETEELEETEAVLAGGRSMDADTGLAVALGHAVAAAVASIHILFFVLLYFNIDPAPVRGYLYMRGLGLMSALTSFYLLFTCVVSFFFAIKGSLDVNMSTSAGLRPSWAYVLTVVDVTIMVVVGMLACQDEEVDAAIATPQYTSSSRDEDTVKRANGKLLHLRSKSSDTFCEASTSLNGPDASASSAPKATVGGGNTPNMMTGGSGLMSGGAHPTATAAAMGALGAGGGMLPGGSGGVGAGGGTVRMSAAAASASAHALGRFAAAAAAAAAGGGGGAATGAESASPAGSGSESGSVLSSWTGGVSALSPRRVSKEGGEEAGEGEGEEEGEEERGGANGRSSSSPRSSGGILDGALYAGEAEAEATGLGSGDAGEEAGGPVVVVVVPGDGGDGQGSTNDGDGVGVGDSDSNGHLSAATAPPARATAMPAGNEQAAAAAAAAQRPPLCRVSPTADGTAAAAAAAAPSRSVGPAQGTEAAATAASIQQASPSGVFSTARTAFSVAFAETANRDEPLDLAEAGRGGGGGGGAGRGEGLRDAAHPPAAASSPEEDV